MDLVTSCHLREKNCRRFNFLIKPEQFYKHFLISKTMRRYFWAAAMQIQMQNKI